MDFINNFTSSQVPLANQWLQSRRVWGWFLWTTLRWNQERWQWWHGIKSANRLFIVFQRAVCHVVMVCFLSTGHLSCDALWHDLTSFCYWNRCRPCVLGVMLMRARSFAISFASTHWTISWHLGCSVPSLWQSTVTMFWWSVLIVIFTTKRWEVGGVVTQFRKNDITVFQATSSGSSLLETSRCKALTAWHSSTIRRWLYVDGKWYPAHETGRLIWMDFLKTRCNKWADFFKKSTVEFFKQFSFESCLWR